MQSHLDKDKPLVTVITACYNSESSIEAAIKSIANQTYNNIQYIIIDANSNDKTLSIISQYGYVVDEFISEPDDGIADAWNKGLSLAKGELIGLLNSDDTYKDDVVEKAVSTYEKSDKFSLMYANCCFIDNGVQVGFNQKVFNASNLSNGIGFGFVHTTCFVPKAIYDSVGRFSLDYKIAIDTDFLVRCYQAGIRFIKSDYTVYMAVGGISDVYSKKAYTEYLNILEKSNLITGDKCFFLKVLYDVYSPFRSLVKSRFFNHALRNLKHDFYYLVNILYSILPTFFIRKFLLKLMGVKSGKCSYILRGLKLYRFGKLSIGNNSIINRDCLLDNRDHIIIGNNVSISHCVSIYTGGHDITTSYFEYFSKPVTINDHACIFPNVIIQPGSVVSEGCVVLSGAVVTGKLEPFSVYAGVPAKKIGSRTELLTYKFDYPMWRAF